jgi:hypothetical protein
LIEVMIAIAVFFTGAILLFKLGCLCCALLYHTVATLVGWPMM